MSFTETWKKEKAKYEDKVKEKKPSEKWLGAFSKSSGVESACKALDAALAAGKRAEAAKAEATLRKSGESYIGTLDRVLQTEIPAVKNMRTSQLKATLQDILHDAHNAIAGFDKGVFETVLGPDVVSDINGVKFPADAFVKSFATNADFAKSCATNAPVPEIASIQKQFAAKHQVCTTARLMFLGNKGKVLPKSEILKIAKATIETMFEQSGRDGMLGFAREWEAAQVRQTQGKKDVMEKFQKSTSMQVLRKVGETLNNDAATLNDALATVQKLKL